MSWKNKKVQNADGRAGVITGDFEGFMHRGLHVKCEDGSEGYVQLNSDGPDSGDKGWEWFRENYDPALGGPRWIGLGDHNSHEFIARSRPLPV